MVTTKTVSRKRRDREGMKRAEQRKKRVLQKAMCIVNLDKNQVVECAQPRGGHSCLTKKAEHVRKNQRVYVSGKIVRNAARIEEDEDDKEGGDVMVDHSLDGCMISLRAPFKGFVIENNVGVIRNGEFELDNVRFMQSTLSMSNHDKMDLIIEVATSKRGRVLEFVWPRAIKVTADGTRFRGKS